MAARSVGRGTHSVLTVKLKISEPFGRPMLPMLLLTQWPPLQWHMDCCKLQFQNVFWSRGQKDVGLLPSVRNALSAATRRQIPIFRFADESQYAHNTISSPWYGFAFCERYHGLLAQREATPFLTQPPGHGKLSAKETVNRGKGNENESEAKNVYAHLAAFYRYPCGNHDWVDCG